MLYDELVPKGEYLAHYGVPKSQWSPEARAKHDRNKKSIVDEHRAQAAEARRNAKRSKNADNNTWTVTPGYKSDPALENVRRQLNRADTVVNNRPRSLRDYSHNGQLVKQNPTLNSFAAENGGSPNNIRLSTKAKKVSKNTNTGNRPGKSSSNASKPTPSSQSADQAIARNMRSGSSTKKNRKDQPNKKGNGSKKK